MEVVMLEKKLTPYYGRPLNTEFGATFEAMGGFG
jgi:hypothetical protein